MSGKTSIFCESGITLETLRSAPEIEEEYEHAYTRASRQIENLVA